LKITILHPTKQEFRGNNALLQNISFKVKPFDFYLLQRIHTATPAEFNAGWKS